MVSFGAWALAGGPSLVPLHPDRGVVWKKVYAGSAGVQGEAVTIGAGEVPSMFGAARGHRTDVKVLFRSIGARSVADTDRGLTLTAESTSVRPAASSR